MTGGFDDEFVKAGGTSDWSNSLLGGAWGWFWVSWVALGGGEVLGPQTPPHPPRWRRPWRRRLAHDSGKLVGLRLYSAHLCLSEVSPQSRFVEVGNHCMVGHVALRQLAISTFVLVIAQS